MSDRCRRSPFLNRAGAGMVSLPAQPVRPIHHEAPLQMHRSLLLAAFLGAALLLAACSSASPSESAAAPSEEASSQPSAAASSGDGTGASFVPGAGSLDGILPDSVGGITLEYQYADGQAVLGSEGVTPEVQDFLNRVGGSIDGVSSAFGIGSDQAAGSFISIFAIRVAGADEGRLRDEFRQVMGEGSDNVFTEANVGGKNVLAFGAAGAEPDGYLYVKGDVVFTVGASTPELNEAVLSQLP